MTTAVDNWPASAWLWAVATAGQLSTAPTPLVGTQPAIAGRWSVERSSRADQSVNAPRRN